MGTLNLQMKLSSIGVGEPTDRIPLRDKGLRSYLLKLLRTWFMTSLVCFLTSL